MSTKTEKAQAVEVPIPEQLKSTTNDTTTGTDATKLPVQPEPTTGTVISDSTNTAIQFDSQQVDKDVSEPNLKAAKAALEGTKQIQETIKEQPVSIQTPTSGRMVTYSPELSDAIYSTAARTWPAVVVYADGLTVDLVVFSSNPRTPAVSRTNVPHASIAEGKPSWDWPVINR